MPYWMQFTLFLLAACAVASVLGHIVAELGLWAVVLSAVVGIPIVIEVGRKVLKGHRL